MTTDGQATRQRCLSRVHTFVITARDAFFAMRRRGQNTRLCRLHTRLSQYLSPLCAQSVSTLVASATRKKRKNGSAQHCRDESISANRFPCATRSTFGERLERLGGAHVQSAAFPVRPLASGACARFAFPEMSRTELLTQTASF